ncbi:hypothetical protein VB779_14150 [Haloarculaceae archaeon H-GB11]|nr:hypothetical protein [Haloarculaceae archaeon H-GB11]
MRIVADEDVGGPADAGEWVDTLGRADASTIGVFGSGPQAIDPLRATTTVRDVESVVAVAVAFLRDGKTAKTSPARTTKWNRWG